MTDSPPPADNDEFGLICSECRTRIFASPQQIGQSIQCPDCLTDRTITELDVQEAAAKRRRRPASRQSPAKNAAADNDEYRLVPEEPMISPPTQANATSSSPREWNAAPAEYIRSPCPLCNTPYSAKPSEEGNSTTCVDCGTVFTIKARKVVKPKQRVVPYDPKIGVSAAAELAEQKERSEALMEKAHEHRKRMETEKPAPPKKPFASGIYGYPFMSRVLPAWVALPVLFSSIIIMVTYAFSLEENAQMLSVLIMVAAIPLSVFSAIYVGYNMLTLMMSTANGYSQPVEWPRFDLGEWFGYALFFWSPLFVGTLPGTLLSTGAPPYVRATMIAISGLLLHPFLFLSMMDANSPVMPYTHQIYRTVKLASGTWMKFYLALAPTFVAVVATCVAAALASGTGAGAVIVVVASIVISLGLTIYFRLLGRLAWVLGDVPTEEEELEQHE